MCSPFCRKLRNLGIKIRKSDAGMLIEIQAENALTSEVGISHA